MCNNTSTHIFQEALNHCRWKSTLKLNVLTHLDLQKSNIKSFKNSDFETIFEKVYDICKPIEGIGLLTCYDIAAAICRYNNIILSKVYLIGKGPKRAAMILNLKPEKQKMKNVILPYVDVSSVNDALKNKNVNFDSSDGDKLETFLCNWQKEQ